MVGRGRGFFDSDRTVTFSKDNPMKLGIRVTNDRVAKGQVADAEEEKILRNWDPMKEDYNNASFNSYTGGLGMELSSVSSGRSPRSSGIRRGVASAPEPGKDIFELYITGIPEDLSDEGLKQLFGRAGKVKKAKVMENRNPHKRGTYGFVGFETKDEVQCAIQKLDNFQIKKHTLRVVLSRTKEEKEEIAARRQAEAAAASGYANGPSTFSQSANSGYASSSSQGPREPRTRRTSGYESSSGQGPKSPRAVQNGEKGGGVSATAEPIQPGPCLRCGKIGSFRCKNCKGPYCGLICQREDWKRHKKSCLKLKQGLESGNDSNKENDGIERSGPMKGFHISIPGVDDGSFDEDDDTPGPASQKTSGGRTMYNDIGQERLPDGTTVMTLCSIQSPVSYTFNIAKNMDLLNNLRKALNETYGKYNENSGEAYVPVKDELVAAYFPLDCSWNRARVIDISDGAIRIKFLDYGNEEIVESKQLRRAHQIFNKWKIQGIDASLQWYSYPKESPTQQEIKILQHILICEAQYQVTNMGSNGSRKDCWLIRLQDMNGVDIGKKLTDAGITVRQESPGTTQQGALTTKRTSGESTGNFQSSNQQRSGPENQRIPRQNGSCPKSPEKVINKSMSGNHTTPRQDASRPSPVKQQMECSPMISPAKSDIPPLKEGSPVSSFAERVDPENPPYTNPTVAKTFYPGREIMIQVIYLEETRFWVQEVSSCTFLDQLTQEMTAYYERKPPKKDFRPTKLGLVAARFPVDRGGDDQFYRAHITGFTAEGNIHVRYLDYANIAEVTYKDVHNLESDHLREDFQAVPVHLADLDPTQTWPAIAKEEFAPLVARPVPAKVVSSTNHYAVLDITLLDQRRLTDVMIELGLRKGIAKKESTGVATSYAQVQSTVENEQVTLKSLDLKDGTTGVVSYANSFENFFIMADNDLMKVVMQELQGYHSKHEQVNPNREGQFVVVLSPEYGEYFRAQVLKMKMKEERARVYYVDYGNKEAVPFANISKMTPALAEIPILAVACSLGVTAKPGKTVDLSCLEPSVGQWQVKLDSQEQNNYVVDLLRDGQSLRDSLIKQGVVEGLTKHKSEIRSKGSGRPELVLPPAEALPKYNQPLKVVVTDASQFDCLYVQLLESGFSEKIMSLSEHLQKEYTNATGLVRRPKEGEAVVAQYSEDKCWYRAVVQRVGEINAFLQFVDYGNTETLPFTHISEIDKTAAGYNIQALKCHLHGVTLVPGLKWDPNWIQVFQPMSAVFIKSEKTSHAIKLTTDEGVDVSEYLISQGLAMSASAPAPTLQAPTPAIVKKASPSLPPSYCPSRFNSPLPLIMIDAPSYDEIYLLVQEEEVERYILELVTKLSSMYEGKEYPPIVVSKGDFVVAKYSKDHNHYRAIVQEVLDDGILVFFVDYGNTEKVTIENISSMTPELSKYPRLALRCSFENVVLASGAQWSAEPLGQATHVIIKEMVSDVAIIDLLSNETSLRKELIDKNVLRPKATETTLTLPSKPDKLERSDLFFESSLPQPVVELDQSCIIIYVNSSTDFYLQVQPHDSIKEILEDYLITYCKEKEADPSAHLTAADVVPGLLVAARFTANGVFYRGIVKEMGPEDTCHVFFVDFGNMEVARVVDLLPLDEKLAKAPVLAVKVSQFFGVADQSKISKASLESCNNVLTIKKAQQMVDGSYRVTLVGEDGKDIVESHLGGKTVKGEQGLPAVKEKLDALLQIASDNPEVLEYLRARLN